MICLQSIVPRHTLDVCMKYSYVPQTEAPYKLDRTSPDIDWAEEPQKVRLAFLRLSFKPAKDLPERNSIQQPVSSGIFF